MGILKESDCLIVGAGAAGLLCAQKLFRSGLQVHVLEGRSRKGGRIWSQKSDLVDWPLEMGAEFLHGDAKESCRLLENSGLGYYPVLDTHLIVNNGKSRISHDYWKKLHDVIRQGASSSARDLSYSQILSQKRIKPSATVERLVQNYIEGFHGGPFDQISSYSVAQAEHENASGPRNFRILGAYEKILTGVGRDNMDFEQQIHLDTTVFRIEWRKGEVNIFSRTEKGEIHWRAPRAVITAPLGVLQSSNATGSRIDFFPSLKTMNQNLFFLSMGHVVRLNLIFKKRFWEKIFSTPFGYLHSNSHLPFPTWWTHRPARLPVLTAWQGGSRGLEISKLTLDKKIDLALKSLSQMTGESLRDISRHFEQGMTHDWSQDAFSCGAYSHVLVGGAKVAKTVFQPIEETLYWAGEACADGALRGTVEGALHSGNKAAQQILKNISLNSNELCRGD